ncbi:hypothetical protein GALMADRAFT_272168 [Galerina marginata CBS 339.88]|uniref:DUF6533 domain-containing protein n=1 Tax=Galerina marginata (strain CBS 339.88) TaxID=685588 RepID=A0A067SEL8_GALM3|nr:hypothetical protein GALMADRAFT_272168 [Galerina marginata CBS 339.88]
MTWLFAERGYAYLTVATAACTLYDIITTLGEEIEFVWNRPKWSVVQILFFINRYVGLALQICTAFVQVRHIGKHTLEVGTAYLGGFTNAYRSIITLKKIVI